MLPCWRLLTAGEGDDFAVLLSKCDFILVADHPVAKVHVLAAPRLKMVQHQGVGYECIDLEACREAGVAVALTPQGTTIGVAEHTLLLILATYKRLLTAGTAVHGGQWPQWSLRAGSFETPRQAPGVDWIRPNRAGSRGGRRRSTPRFGYWTMPSRPLTAAARPANGFDTGDHS